MDRVHVEAEETSRARVDAVWALVSDANSYAKWGPWIEGGYDPAGKGPSVPGSVQWFQFGRRTRSVEKILEVDAPSRIVYTVIRGIPVKNYRAEVTLTPNQTSGTTIRWSATWDKTFKGRLVRRKLQTVYRQVVDNLVAAADHDAAADNDGHAGIQARDERS